MTTTVSKRHQSSTQKIVLCGVFSALAFVLYLLEFPVIPAFPHLKLDFSEIPALIGAVFFGPIYGVIIELVKNAIELLIKGMGTQMGFGNLMNFLVGCAYVVPFSIFYNKLLRSKDNKENKNINIKAITVSSIISTISIILVGILSNYFIAPLFFNYFLNITITKEILWGAIWSATILNAIKAIIISLVIYPFIKLISRIKIF